MATFLRPAGVIPVAVSALMNLQVALPAAEGSKVEVRSDARYFFAEGQVQERYLEQIAGPPLQLEASGAAVQVHEERRLLDVA